MTWLNTAEGRYTRETSAGGEWLIQKFKIGDHSELLFRPAGASGTAGTIAIALCESVAEARVISHALDGGIVNQVSSPLEQLFDAGYVQDKRLPADERVRCIVDLARRPGVDDPEVSDALIWMTRRDGTMTIAIDEQGDIPLLTCRLDIKRGELHCGTVFYRTNDRAERPSQQPSIELFAYLELLAERTKLNGSHLEPLRGAQFSDLADRFVQELDMGTADSMPGPRI